MSMIFVLFSALLAVTSAGVVTTIGDPAAAVAQKVHYVNPAVDAVASTYQNVVRSFGGTVSHHSKAVDTPYSSVRKEDTRISNNNHTPAIAKTVTYAAPAPATHAAIYTHAAPVLRKVVHAAAPSAAVYTHHHDAQPTVYMHHHNGQPTVYTHHQVAPTATVYTHSAPVVSKTVSYAAPAAYVYHQESPAVQVHHHETPAASTYTHSAPGVAAYGSSHTVRYSPAETVSHISFDGFGTHWGL